MKHSDQLVQTPSPDSRIIAIRGDTIRFELRTPPGLKGNAWLRTNIGRTRMRLNEIVRNNEYDEPILAKDWTDIPMQTTGRGIHEITLPLLHVGLSEAKTFFAREQSTDLLWPRGGNVLVKTEPWQYARWNTIYSAFVRQFTVDPIDPPSDITNAVSELEGRGWATIPPSGKFRELTRRLDFIMGKMGFRIIQLLPIHPAPTTYARMGRFGSPYAALDFMDVDPALAEFDRKTTPMQQFEELVDAVHARNGRIFIDIPVNHTGWGSHLQVTHPEWFVRNRDNTFQSPGAWGVTWEDLAKLDYDRQELRKHMARVFLFWCAKGVDGFRCDAGYMIPTPTWEYIVAKVRCEYPDTVFLLEGLGGKISVMKDLLERANLDWAYSELFQNYSREQIEAYLPGCIDISTHQGNLVHYAETHDNNRLASESQEYARMRTALSAMFSRKGGFGITAGVEWYATEKIDVHGASCLNWNGAENQVDFISRLNRVIYGHPCFGHDVRTALVHKNKGPAIVLKRELPDGTDSLLVAVNLDTAHVTEAQWEHTCFPVNEDAVTDLITGNSIPVSKSGNLLACNLLAGQVACLSPAPASIFSEEPNPFTKHPLQMLRQAALCHALEIREYFHPETGIDDSEYRKIADRLLESPEDFYKEMAGKDNHVYVTSWRWPHDTHRLVMIPPGSPLLITAPHPFRARLKHGARVVSARESLMDNTGRHFTLFMPSEIPSDHTTENECALELTAFTPNNATHSETRLAVLPDAGTVRIEKTFDRDRVAEGDIHGLCTNGRGAMSLARGKWGEIRSRYDALLAANLNDNYPVDRTILLTRCRAWLVHNDYSTEINETSLKEFSLTPCGALRWRFDLPCGAGLTAPVSISLDMQRDRNRICLKLDRPIAGPGSTTLPDSETVQLIIRPDIECRSFHNTTKAYAGPETAWPKALKCFETGFTFRPEGGSLEVTCSKGNFSLEPEWTYMVNHAIEEERGLDPNSDLFSPGWFAIELKGGETSTITANADEHTLGGAADKATNIRDSSCFEPVTLIKAMESAMRDFIVKRDSSRSVIAGYPWFLDWGRDTLICLRGMISAGLLEESTDILKQFAFFENGGTLPNMIRGNDDSNRDTSDAPLWFFTACSDLLAHSNDRSFLEMECGRRKLTEVLVSIARNYIEGTVNGIKMDPETGLVFSPAHFTWMDTNHPAGTPRQGYPVEIQALWFAALRFLGSVDGDPEWPKLAKTVRDSILRLYPVSSPDAGLRLVSFLSDCIHADPGVPATQGTPDDALRPNQLLAITLDCIEDTATCRGVLRACEELLVPGAIRSLADRPVKHAIPVISNGKHLNDPLNPYWGHYSGDEDTRRKPAYHNGTAWTWLFPSYPEALFKLYGKAVKRTASAILHSSAAVVKTGCAGHVPEVLDGNIPHLPRGCCAQAWGATELYRVARLLRTSQPPVSRG